MLDPVGDSSIAEQTLLAFTATGSDPDLDGLTFSLSGEPAGAAITAGGAFTFTPTEAQGPGSYTFDVVVTDDGTPNLTDTETITITVTETNVAPVVTNPGNQTDAETDVISLFVAASDADCSGEHVDVVCDRSPGVAVDQPGTGEIFGTLTYTSAGSYPVSVTATDDGTPNLADTVNFTWDVTNTNRIPIVVNPGNQTNNENDIISLTLAGSDPDGGPVTWSAINLPPGLSINPTTGEISGTLTYTSAGIHAIQATATDSELAPTTMAFTWTVNDINRAPTVVNPGNQTNERERHRVTGSRRFGS